MNNIDKFLLFRQYVLLFSKIVAIIFCFYYIKHSNDYKLSYPLLQYILPTKVLTFISNIGTIILIIPLTIILTSLLIPQHNTLHILSSFFGTMSLLIIFIKNLIFNNSIGEVTNFKLLTVERILTLPQKRDIFQQEFTRIVNENYLSMIKTYDYLMSKLNLDYFVKYDIILNNLKLPSQIKQYAAETVVAFTKEVATNTPFTIPLWVKITLVIGGLLFSLYIINNVFFKDDSIPLQQTHADLTGSIATVGASTAEASVELGKNVSAHVDVTHQSLNVLQQLNERVDKHDLALAQNSIQIQFLTTLIGDLVSVVKNLKN